MHAVVVQVTIRPGRADEATRLLSEQVLPRSMQSTGFLDGYWMRSDDGAHGMSVGIFDRRDAAVAFAATVAAAAADGPIIVDSVTVQEVIAST